MVVSGRIEKTFQADDFRAFHLAARLVIVKCTSKEYGFYIVSGHAPCRNATAAAIAWWCELPCTIRKFVPAGATLLFGIDMNATPSREADDVFNG